MKTKIVLSILILIGVGVSLSFVQSENPTETGKAKYILVKSAFMMRSEIFKPNAALLIKDEGEIGKNEKLFLDNRTYGHACGYHYSVQFWNDSLDLIDDVPFNQECEEFVNNNMAIQSKMKDYIKQLETDPTHYIYNLEIPVSTNPKELIQYFANSGLNIFFLNGKSNHFSTLSFSYNQVVPIKELEDRSQWQIEQNENQENATKKIKSIIDLISQVAEIKEQSKISFPMQSFGGGEIEHQGEVTLKFDNGINLSEIKEIISLNHGKIEGVLEPNKYYVQLVDESDALEKVRIKMKKFDMVKNVYEYPKTK